MPIKSALSSLPFRVAPSLAGLRLGGALLLSVIGTGFGSMTHDLNRMEALALERYGADAARTVAAWRRMMLEAQALPALEQLGRVNAFFNRNIAFDDDNIIWKQQDYWATPLETLARGAGDCEDFSIAKYMTLRLLGMPAERLKLIYVRARIGGEGSTVTQAHMVVGYFAEPGGEPLVLDNLIRDIRPAARRPDLFPVFSFDSEGLWVGNSTTSAADPTARLSRWRDALFRMQREGLHFAPTP
jgi:predicted transglutaminase-like cysteine proteinase